MAQILLKIVEQDSDVVLMSFLIEKVDKKSAEFQKLCELKYLTKTPRANTQEERIKEDFRQLEKALSLDLPSKARYFANRLA